MSAFFFKLDPAIQAACVNAVITVVISIAGIFVLVWRLRREAQRAIEDLKTAQAMKLKLKIYEQDVLETVDTIIDAEAALCGFIHRFEIDLLHCTTTQPATPVARVPVLIDLKSDFNQATIGIVAFVEKWLVVDPRFSIFKTAINAASYDVDIAWDKYFNFAMKTMPRDKASPLTGILMPPDDWLPPKDAEAEAVITSGKLLIDCLRTVAVYASDFRREMQSALVGPLFGNAVPRRQPIDPRHMVITLADADTLARGFDASPWGQQRHKTEVTVSAEI